MGTLRLRHFSQAATLFCFSLWAFLSTAPSPAEAQYSTQGMVQWSWGPNPSNDNEFQFSGTYANGTTVFLTLGWVPESNTSYTSSTSTRYRVCNGENLLVNGGFERGDFSGWNPGYWNVSLCTAAAGTCGLRRQKPKDGTYAVTANGTDFELSQTVDVSGYPSDAEIELFGWSYQMTIQDTLTATLDFFKADGVTPTGTSANVTRSSPLRPMFCHFNFEIDDLGTEFQDRAFQLDDLTYRTSVSGSMYGLEAQPVKPGLTYTPTGTGRYALGGIPFVTNTYPLGTTFSARLNNGGFSCANNPNCWSMAFAFRPASSGSQATLIQTYTSSSPNTNRLTVWFLPAGATGSLIVEWIANGQNNTGTIPGITANDWWLVAIKTRSLPFQIMVSQTAFPGTTLNFTGSTAVPSSLVMDTLLIGQDITGTRGLQGNQIDLLGIVEEPLSAGEFNAWRTAIDSQSPLTSSSYTFGYRRFSATAAMPSDAKYARLKLTFFDTNPNTVTWQAMDNFGVRCIGSPVI